MPARLPVVTEVQASAVPGAVSRTLRSGLRKFTARKARDAVARDRELALPDRLAAAAAILRALPQHAHAAAEIAGARTAAPTAPPRVPCSTSTRSIGAVPITSADSFIGTRAGPDDVAHPRLAHRDLLRRAELRIVGEAGHLAVERAAAGR